MAESVQHTSVLVVGGGLVTGLFLQRQGVPFILVERERRNSPLRPARGWAVRSVELFRSLDLQQAMEGAAEAAWEQGVFDARRGATVLSSEALGSPTRA